MKLVKNIFIKIIWIILFILIGFNIYNFVSINILHKDIADINGYALLEVVSGSMDPTIKIGDVIVIDTNNQEYKSGDIITFYDVNGSFVTHRLMRIDDKMMVTKGDANDSEDEAMDKNNIVGKMVFKIDGLGKLMASLKNPFVMLLIMVIGIVLCLLMSTDKDLLPKDLTDEEKAFIEYKRYHKEKDKKQKKKEIIEEVKEEMVVSPEAEVIGEIIEVSVEELEEQQREEEKILREQLKKELREELKEELRQELKNEMIRKNNNSNNKKKNHNNKQNYYKKNNKKKNNKNKGHQGNKNNKQIGK